MSDARRIRSPRARTASRRRPGVGLLSELVEPTGSTTTSRHRRQPERSDPRHAPDVVVVGGGDCAGTEPRFDLPGRLYRPDSNNAQCLDIRPVDGLEPSQEHMLVVGQEPLDDRHRARHDHVRRY